MDRRKFLAGSLAVGTATVTASASAKSPESDAKETSLQGSNTRPADWRLQYPVTKQEKRTGKVVHDLTYPSGDPRRYEKAAKAELRARYPDHL